MQEYRLTLLDYEQRLGGGAVLSGGGGGWAASGAGRGGRILVSVRGPEG